MKQMMLVGVSILVASTVWAGPRSTKPKWCAQKVDGGDGSIDDLKKPDVRDQLRAVIGFECNPGYNYEPDPWSAVDAAHKQLSARLGLTDDDWADVVNWASESGWGSHGISAKPDKKAWSQLDPVEQYATLQRKDDVGEGDLAYLADALGDHLSETGRLAWITWCIKQQGDEHAVAWAMCQPDIDAFDAKKVAAEMRAAKGASGHDRIYLRLEAEDMKASLAAHAADVKKLLASDPVYGQMFDIAKKQRTEWKASPDIVALQVAMEDARVTDSRKAADGCADKTWKAVLSSISKIPAKTFQLHHKDKEETAIYLHDMNDVVASGLLSEPDSYLAVNAHAMCRTATETANDDMLMGLIYAVGARWSGYRGPRTAAQTRIFLANLKPDDRSARIAYPRIARYWFGDHNGAGGGFGGYGTVTKVSSKGGKVHLEFQKHKHQEYVSLNCKSTGRIQAIRDNGEIVYEETCADSKLLTTMEGQDPLDVGGETAKAVKVGMVVDIEHGVVLVAWPNEKSDTPVLVLGQPVK